MKPVFRTFLSKNGFLHARKALRNQGSFLLHFSRVKAKTLKTQNEYFYAKSLFEHGFTINSPSTPPQMPVGSSISRSDGDAVHYRIGHIAPRFCGSFAPRCTPCGTPPLFEGSKERFGDRVVMGPCCCGKGLFRTAFLQQFRKRG